MLCKAFEKKNFKKIIGHANDAAHKPKIDDHSPNSFFFWPWALNPGHCPEGSGIAVRGIEAMAGKQISTQAIAYKSHTPERIEIHRL